AMADIEIGKIDFGYQPAMKRERGALAHLFDPVLQAAGDRERQLPQHPLKPHSPHEHANEPRAEVRSCALGGVLLPVLDGDHDARDDESQEQRNEKILPNAEGVVIIGVPDHEIPQIRERIWHGTPPAMRPRWGYRPAQAREFMPSRRSSFSLTRLALCPYPMMPAVAQDRGLLGENCGQRKGARERLNPLVHCNVIVPAFGLLVWL